MSKVYKSRLWVLVFTIVLCVWQGNALSQSDELPCDFEVEIAEPDFCVIHSFCYDNILKFSLFVLKYSLLYYYMH